MTEFSFDESFVAPVSIRLVSQARFIGNVVFNCADVFSPATS